MVAAFTDLLVDRDANDTAAEFVRSQIRDVVEDPDVAERLSPRGHPFGTKRPCLDTDYYATYNRDNVSLVDVRDDPIVEITPTRDPHRDRPSTSSTRSCSPPASTP